MVTSYDAYHWLKGRHFDVVHFPELFGHGYYSILSKRQGLDFADTTFCIGTHSPTSWLRAMNREFLESAEELQLDFMERQSVALADVVLSPSQYMLQWLQERGWQLPAQSYVQQYTLSSEMLRIYRNARNTRRDIVPPREIVFFGRLEERKGLAVFCDALDRVGGWGLEDFEVVFLGRSGRVDGKPAIPYIRERARRWPFAWRLSTDQGHAEALQFLQREGRVAIVPSLEDNLPNTVLECLCSRIPFIASRAGGTAELICDDDLEQVTFAPNPNDLANRLFEVLTKGVPTARAAVDPEENRRQWIQWHGTLPARSEPRAARSPVFVRDEAPLVSVCLALSDHCRSLEQVVSSLTEQDWPNLEVIVATESAGAADSLARMSGRQTAGRAKGLRVIKEVHGSIAAARNAAAMRAGGDCLLFMDDDSCAKPDEISTFMQVRAVSGADILTCFMHMEQEPDEEGEEQAPGRWLFLGAAAGAGMFQNFLGAGNFLVPKAVFRTIGNFSDDCALDWQDWEWLSKAVLMGFRLEVVPRELAWYRPTSTSSTVSDYQSRMRSLQPYLDAVPSCLRDVVQLAMSMNLRMDRLHVVNGPLCLDDLEMAGVLRGLASREHRKVASFLNAWLEYRTARSNMPAHRRSRVPHIARQLMRGRYHRFAHGFGSALRDLRRPSRPFSPGSAVEPVEEDESVGVRLPARLKLSR